MTRHELAIYWYGNANKIVAYAALLAMYIALWWVVWPIAVGVTILAVFLWSIEQL